MSFRTLFDFMKNQNMDLKAAIQSKLQVDMENKNEKIERGDLYMHEQNLLSLAVQFSTSCLEILLENSDSFLNELKDLRDSLDRTALHLAACNSKDTAVKLLVSKGFEAFKSKDCFGYTPLHLACLKGK